MYNYLMSFIIVICLAIYFYLKRGLSWQVYIFLAAALVYLVLFFIKILKSKKPD